MVKIFAAIIKQAVFTCVTSPSYSFDALLFLTFGDFPFLSFALCFRAPALSLPRWNTRLDYLWYSVSKQNSRELFIVQPIVIFTQK